MVILHHTAMLTAKAAIERLCDPKSEVSAHYVISEAGEITQLVAEVDRAWHAGAGAWGGNRDLNSHSIGIELANAGPHLNEPPFAAAQIDALEALLSQISARHKIAAKNVIAHSDMAPTRKNDPGPKFDWQRLARRGQAVWPNDVHSSDNEFLSNAARFGYVLNQAQGIGPDELLAAFRLRFRPGYHGPEDGIDRAMIANLAARFPVDPPLLPL